jgi:thymidylate synthase (FAD)
MPDVRIITDPTVYVLGRPSIDQRELTRLLTDTGFPLWSTNSPCDAQALVETGARLCYRSFRGGRPHGEHVRHLIEVGHGSCLEHAVWTLVVTGISRTCSHELVRHRFLSPSQESQRYVDAADVAFVLPPALVGAWDCWVNHTGRGLVVAASGDVDPRMEIGLWFDRYWYRPARAAVESYAELYGRLTADGMPRKAAREAARSVLPGCVETRIQLTGNARAWRAFIEQRATRHADAEIRRLAVAVHAKLEHEAPGLFSDYKRVPLPDGTDELATEYRKV